MNEEAYIDENVKIASDFYPESLNDNELQLVDSVSKKYLELMKIACTGLEESMQNTNNKFRHSLSTGLAKGWSGFVWMLKYDFLNKLCHCC